MAEWVPGPVTLAAAALTAGLLVGAFAGTTTASTQDVSSCITISEPGTYELAGNVSGPADATCLRITASDVTVDGNGYTISATDGATEDPPLTTGVLVAPPDTSDSLRNVSVRNVSASGWGTGVSVQNAQEATLDDVTVRANRNGIVLTESSRVVVRESTAVDNDDGILTRDLTASRFEQVLASENAETGIYTSNDFEGNQLVNTTARENGGDGLRIGPAWNSSFRATTAVGNGDDGLAMLDTGAVTVDGLNVSNNGAAGMQLTAVSGTRFETVTALNNSNAYVAVDSRNVSVDALTIDDGGPFALTAGSATVSSVASPPATPENLTVVGPVVNVSGTTDGSDGAVFLSIPVENRSRGIAPSLWRYDGGQWTELTERRFDSGVNGLTATVGDGIFAPLTANATTEADATG